MKFRELLILASSVAAASQASALSLGNTQGHVILGAPMDLVFQIQPDANQTTASSCITANVWMGDTPLSQSQITLTPQANAVRISTRTPVYEPLVSIKIDAGCAGAISRSYTFFADPPRALAASVEPIDLGKIQLSTLTAAGLAAPAQASVEKKPRPAKRPVAQKTVKPASAAAPIAAATAVNAPIEVPVTPPSTAVEVIPAATTSGGEKARLRVEPIEGLDAPLDALATASENAGAGAGAGMDSSTQILLDANNARLEAMEKQLQTLQTQLTGNRSEVINLQTQLVQAQNEGLPIWVHIMLGILALALATIAWLLHRIKQERLNAQGSWADTVLAVEDSDQATTIDTQAPHASPAGAQTSAPAVAEEAHSNTATPTPAFPSIPSASSWSHAEAPALMHDQLYAEFEKLSIPQAPSNNIAALNEILTAQALFDVQEQAEFYASIGENDHAIEILQTHIAQHESSSPLAYIELLQLLYRLGRTEAFAQVREKFQNHFNVNAPDFLGFARKGHDLWNAYPEILGKIEALWPTDEVQPMLRSLIVRNTSADHPADELRFDLSAFDDLLMLYNVAQTTPASSRGELPGRRRTSPNEVPLPEVFLDKETPLAIDVDKISLPAATLTLQDVGLDMLDAAPAQAPVAPAQPLNDSPFQGPAHLVAPDQALIDELSLTWEAHALPSLPAADSSPAPEKIDHPVDDLDTFSMDERDLPSLPKK